MKTLKLLFYSLLISLFTLTSCTNNDSILEDLADPQQSDTMQSVLAELITLYNDDGTIISDLHPTGNLIFDFCFEFVYPIELIYNNGSTVTINNLAQLIEVLINQTSDLFIVGIEFPFDVEIFNHATNQFEIITIHNEEEFAQLLENCIFEDCICDDNFDPVCVEIEENGQIIIITFPNACFAECEGFTEDQYFPCDGCDDCPKEYDPVCVLTDNGIVEFHNACFAECEGYTEADFVDCPVDLCVIDALEVVVGDCNPDGTYSITINFEHVNAGNDFFDVFVRNNELIGSYPLSELPLTISEFELSGFDFDYLKVCINDNSDCCDEIEWEAPNCEVGECDIFDLNIVVGDCIPGSDLYALTIDFEYNDPGNDFFDVYIRNDELIGTFPLASLPITIEDFQLSGLDFDFVKVCINDNPNCCQDIEWEAPDCNIGGECDIFDLQIEVGDCNPDTTYSLTINFDYVNPGNDFFDVFVRDDVFVGFYALSDLPITIENFELSGFDFDFVKVCINDNPNCCDEIEYVSPNCD